MKYTVEKCTIILRQLSREQSIAETTHSVSSLEELYDYCLSMKEPRLLEMLMLVGSDRDGRRRALTFTFQSISDQNNPKAP